MKNIFLLPIFFFSIYFILCSKDDNSGQEMSEETPNPDDQVIINATDTCLMQDIEFLSREPTKINCLLDLEGKEITVLDYVTLNFDEEDVFNESLNFSGNNKISGELLNSKLTIEGEVSLINEEFQFTASRRGIIERMVSDEIAKNNHLFMNKTFIDVKELGATAIKK